MLNFLQAAALAYAHAVRELGDDPPLAAAGWGWEGPDAFQVLVDSRARLVEGQVSAGLMDTPMYLVDKRTGQVNQVDWEWALEVRDEWAEVGTRPPVDTDQP